MEARFSDTTYRDGSQSLWALGMRGGMIEATAELMDQAGYDAIEVPVTGIFVKKFVRDLKEDSWEIARMMARKITRTTKQNMGGAFFHPFEAPPPRSIIELFFARVVETGVLDRIQVTTNTLGQLKGPFPWLIPMFRNLGLQVSLAISFSISPRHTDEYYAQKTREVVAFKPDMIYLKDQGGLLTMDRIRTLFPVIKENANGVPVELHSHCTTGLAPLVYLEALKLGASVLHTAVPPLANGASQPSIFNVASNARLMGYPTGVDESIVRKVSERLTAIAKRDKLPIGAPLEYDYAQYIHQVPGGVISNLKFQLSEMRCLHLLDKVLEEAVQVRKELGYPIMITPHSQFVVYAVHAQRDHGGTLQACHRRGDPVCAGRFRGGFGPAVDGSEPEGQAACQPQGEGAERDGREADARYPAEGPAGQAGRARGLGRGVPAALHHEGRG